MWPRECFLVIFAVILFAGVSSAHSPRFGTDAVISKRSVTPDKPDEQHAPATEDLGEQHGEQHPLGEQHGAETTEEKLPSSCKEIPSKVSGKYEIQFGLNKTRLSVYCEQTAHGGGWIVFQHRFNGSVDFYRNWIDYRDGFGSLDGEFWLGLESLYQLASARPHELMVEIKDYNGREGYAHYDQFVIGNETEQYRLTIGKYDGTAGDSLNFSSNAKFITKDLKKDPSSFLHCAVHLQGAWWYNDCSQSNLNGIYGNLVWKDWVGMHWQGLENDYRSMQYSKMMIREVD